jgi:hypothetical protein
MLWYAVILVGLILMLIYSEKKRGLDITVYTPEFAPIERLCGIFSELGTNNLLARGCDTHEDLHEKYRAAVVRCRDLDRLVKKVEEAEAGLAKRYQGTPWKILVHSGEIEQGLPFTFQDVIVMPEKYVMDVADITLVRTLRHEKIHVYQRGNLREIDREYSDMGFEAVDGNELPVFLLNNLRYNPDLSYPHLYSWKGWVPLCILRKGATRLTEVDCIYYNAKTGQVKDSFPEYEREYPGIHNREHPNEIVAERDS